MCKTSELPDITGVVTIPVYQIPPGFALFFYIVFHFPIAAPSCATTFVAVSAALFGETHLNL